MLSERYRTVIHYYFRVILHFFLWMTMKIFSDVEQELDLQEMEILDDLTFEFI